MISQHSSYVVVFILSIFILSYVFMGDFMSSGNVVSTSVRNVTATGSDRGTSASDVPSVAEPSQIIVEELSPVEKVDKAIDDSTVLQRMRLAQAEEFSDFDVPKYQTSGTLSFPSHLDFLNGTSGKDVIQGNQIQLPYQIGDPQFQYEVISTLEGNDEVYGTNVTWNYEGTPWPQQAIPVGYFGGNDIIDGGPGSDILVGNSEDDVIYGGYGAENLSSLAFEKHYGAIGSIFYNDSVSPGTGINFTGCSMVFGNELCYTGDHDTGYLDSLDQFALLNFGYQYGLEYRIETGKFYVPLYGLSGVPTSQINAGLKNIYFFDFIIRAAPAPRTHWEEFVLDEFATRYPGAVMIEVIWANSDLLTVGGTDIFNGRAGDDLAFGGPGNDFLDGDVGRDHYYGGPGADTFIYSNSTGSTAFLTPVMQPDSIYDYDVVEGDKLAVLSVLDGYTTILDATEQSNSTYMGKNESISSRLRFSGNTLQVDSDGAGSVYGWKTIFEFFNEYGDPVSMTGHTITGTGLVYKLIQGNYVIDTALSTGVLTIV